MLLSEQLTVCFDPIAVGKVRLKNRLVFPSMCTYYSDGAGSMTPGIKAFVEARARGGVGTFIVPGSVCGATSSARPAISEDRHIDGWAALKETAFASGMGLFCQLHPPDSIQPKLEKHAYPESYSIADIGRLVDAYAAAAARARKAGLDGVEIHGAHGHEIALFLSPYYNRRRDIYGGDLLGRSKFAFDIVRAIKETAGADFPIIFRFSVEERIPGGRDLAESLRLVSLLEGAGVDALHVSVGALDSPGWEKAPMDVSPGHLIPLASQVKKIASVPVIAVGRIDDLSLAAEAIGQGHADMIAMGRALLADPDLPKKTWEGRKDEIRRCIACNQGCGTSLPQRVTCLQNPHTGRESTLAYAKVFPGHRKSVLIAGAGPAGLEAACVLSERGHNTMLFEQASEAGGNFLLAARPPFKEGLLRVVHYRMNRLRNLGTKMIFGTKVDSRLVKDIAPDIVIVATGSRPGHPSFPVEGGQVYTADAVLSGMQPAGKKTLVIGGGMVGCEVADYLVHRGYEVDIAHGPNSLAMDLNETRRGHLLKRLEASGVRFYTGVRVLKVTVQSVTWELSGRVETMQGYDSVVLAIGRRSNSELVGSLASCSPSPEVFTIGDALSPRTALEAISEASLAAAHI